MFELNPNDFITPKERCLYNIFELLNSKKEVKEIARDIKPAKVFKCKHCGAEFENNGLLLAHYREHKRSDKA